MRLQGQQKRFRGILEGEQDKAHTPSISGTGQEEERTEKQTLWTSLSSLTLQPQTPGSGLCPWMSLLSCMRDAAPERHLEAKAGIAPLVAPVWPGREGGLPCPGTPPVPTARGAVAVGGEIPPGPDGARAGAQTHTLNPWDKGDTEITRMVPRPQGSRERLNPVTTEHGHQLGLQQAGEQTPQSPVSSDPGTSRRTQSHLLPAPGTPSWEGAWRPAKIQERLQ